MSSDGPLAPLPMFDEANPCGERPVNAVLTVTSLIAPMLSTGIPDNTEIAAPAEAPTMGAPVSIIRRRRSSIADPIPSVWGLIMQCQPNRSPWRRSRKLSRRISGFLRTLQSVPVAAAAPPHIPWRGR